MGNGYYAFSSCKYVNEASITDRYFNLIVKEIGAIEADKFIKKHPLIYNSEFNRFQNFPV